MAEDIFSKETDFSEEDAFLDQAEAQAQQQAPEAEAPVEEEVPVEEESVEETTDQVVPEEPIESPNPVQEFAPDDPSKEIQEPALPEKQVQDQDQEISTEEPTKPLRELYDKGTLEKFGEELAYAEEDQYLDSVGEQKQKNFFGETTWATIKDVGTALIKAVPQIALEVTDTAGWIADNAQKLDPITAALDLVTGFGEERETLQNRRESDFKATGAALDSALPVETGLGEMAGTVAQFATAFTGLGTFQKGVTAIRATPTIINNMTKVGLATFLGFDEHTSNMSDLVESFPSLSTPLTKMLAHDDDDGVFEGKLKNTVEALGLGAAGGLMMAGFKFMKKLAPRGWREDGVPRTIVDESENLSKSLTGSAKKDFDAGVVQLADKEKSGLALANDVLVHLYTSSLLSIKSHAANIVSIPLTVMDNLGATTIARGVTKLSEATGNSLLKGQKGVEAGEIGSQLSGMFNSMGTAVDLAGEAFRTGKSQFGRTKLDVDPTMSAKKLGMDETTILGSGVDLIAKFTNLTGKGMGATDEFAKVVHAAGAMSQLTFRQAVREGKTGEALTKRIAELSKSGDKDIIKQSEEIARINTFTNDLGPMASKVQRLREDFPILKFVVPFYPTLANITKFGFDRFPPTTMLFKNNKEAWARGGADQAMVMGKLGMGSAYTATAASLFYSGILTGKLDMNNAAVRGSGMQEYSIKVGDSWINYSKYAPVGNAMKLVVDSFDVLNHLTNPDDEETTKQVVLNAISTVGESLLEGTFADSMSQFLEAARNPAKAGQFLEDKLKAILIPGVVSDVAKLVDPHVREAQGFIDKLKQSIPGLSDDLPLRYDAFGREQQSMGVAGFLGVKMTSETPDTFDDVLVESDISISSPKYTQSFSGVKMNLREYPEIFSEMMKLTGEVKVPKYGNKTLSETLNDITSGEGYRGKQFTKKSDGPNGGKELLIREIVNTYRDYARDKIYAENEDFRTIVKTEKAVRRAKQDIHNQILGE